MRQCRVCKTKDGEIEFLRKMVENLTGSTGNKMSYAPTYINEFGEIVDTTVKKDDRVTVQEIDSINEILGH